MIIHFHCWTKHHKMSCFMNLNPKRYQMKRRREYLHFSFCSSIKLIHAFRRVIEHKVHRSSLYNCWRLGSNTLIAWFMYNNSDFSLTLWRYAFLNASSFTIISYKNNFEQRSTRITCIGFIFWTVHVSFSEGINIKIPNHFHKNNMYTVCLLKS